jgi:outer membrane protein
MRITFLLFAFWMGWLSAHAQPSKNPVLAEYIRQALDSNLVVKQKKIGLEKSMLALGEARGYFLPDISFGGSYFLAKGGRFIDIPVGDLLNPVYSTLNQLTGGNQFPQIKNVSEQFLPNNFYDVKVRTTYPILNPDLRYNKQIKEQQIDISEAELAIYKRELIKDVKTAYFQYLLALEGARIYENTIAVVERGLKVNESLYKNGKGLPAYINRSEADVQQVEAQWQTALNEAQKAKAYFNFLLNRPLHAEILVSIPELPETVLLPDDDRIAVGQREEFEQLQTAENISKTVIKMNESFRQPRVSTFLDLGSQGFDIINADRGPYYMLGLQLDMPIFQGKRNLNKIDQSRRDLENVQTQKELVTRQIELSAFTARNNVMTALANYRVTHKQVQAATSYFKLIDRGRTEGTNSFIEWLDARNQLTTAEVQQQINKYRALMAWADYERQTATVIIE